jgi:hypothetical protein
MVFFLIILADRPYGLQHGRMYSKGPGEFGCAVAARGFKAVFDSSRPWVSWFSHPFTMQNPAATSGNVSMAAPTVRTLCAPACVVRCPMAPLGRAVVDELASRRLLWLAAAVSSGLPLGNAPTCSMAEPPSNDSRCTRLRFWVARCSGCSSDRASESARVARVLQPGTWLAVTQGNSQLQAQQKPRNTP